MATPAKLPAQRVILVVDDEQLVCHLTARILVDAGFPVVEAHSGEEAAALLDALGPRKVGLVVSDIRMPGMSGLELSALMMDQWPTVPVLLLSGQGGPPTGYPGPFLPKPFAPEAFVAAVHMLLPDALPSRQLH